MKARSLPFHRSLFRGALAGLCLSLCGAAGARAQTPTATPTPTTISALPYTITTGGTYVLTANLSSPATSGSLITVSASNVTINMQDHHITGNGGTGTGTVGISVSQENNVTVENGTISGCLAGIELLGTSGNNNLNVNQRVLNMRVFNCYLYGLEIEYAPSCNVTGCQVFSIGGTTLGTLKNIGIRVLGAGTTVQNCLISNVATPSGSLGACLTLDTGSFARQNQLFNAADGIIAGNSSAAGGIYQDNLASNCTTAFTGGTDGGGNITDGGTSTDTIRGGQPAAK